MTGRARRQQRKRARRLAERDAFVARYCAELQRRWSSRERHGWIPTLAQRMAFNMRMQIDAALDRLVLARVVEVVW